MTHPALSERVRRFYLRIFCTHNKHSTHLLICYSLQYIRIYSSLLPSAYAISASVFISKLNVAEEKPKFTTHFSLHLVYYFCFLCVHFYIVFDFSLALYRFISMFLMSMYVCTRAP